MTNVHLVTDFPSFFGERLLRRILEEEEDAVAICLVRPSQKQSAEAAIRRLEEEAGARTEILYGEEASMHLGLSSREHRRLRLETTFIHHLSGIEARGGPATWHASLRGAENVLELAREAKSLRRLCHFSSVRVAGRAGLADEDEIAPVGPWWNLQDETRARIERRLRGAMPDVPTTIFRPSRIIGDSVTGEVPRHHVPLETSVRLALPPFHIPLPLPGAGSAPFHAVPANWVAAAAYRLSRREAAVGKTFHLVDPDPMPLAWVWEQVALHMGRRSLGTLRSLVGLPFLTKLFADGGPFERLVEYGCRNTLEHLGGAGEGCPPLHSYLGRLLGWAEAQVKGRQSAVRDAVASDPFC